MRAEYSRIPVPFRTWPSTMSNCALLINGPIVIPSDIPSPTRLNHYNGIRRPRPYTAPNRWRDRPLTVPGRERQTSSRIGGYVDEWCADSLVRSGCGELSIPAGLPGQSAEMTSPQPFTDSRARRATSCL
jgi:hypothetical protein